MIFVPAICTPTEQRKGVVLLVVMALLTLFAAVGLSFVFYAEAESTAASYGADAPRKNIPDVEPEMLLAYYLNQLLFDVDDTNGAYSALRGHSLGRNAWGYNYTVAGGTYYINPNGIPFTGIGRAASDNVVNYIYYPTDGLTYDPERGKLTRTSNTAAQINNYIAGNVGYTFPDRNNIALGAMNGSGEILIQSGYRPWMETVGNKYTYLRPDPTWNTKFYTTKDVNGNLTTPDGDPGGHVKNVENSPGTVYYKGGTKLYYLNDSWWVDLGYPVQIAPNGQKYKPLFAAFVTDMDNKLNLNAHGNIRVNQTTHASSGGVGPWEVNLNKVLTQADWINIFLGNTGTYPGLYGRYDQTNRTPTKGGSSGNSYPPPPVYSQYDLDGATTLYKSLSNKYVAPGENPILAATNAAPIQITATNHGFVTGDTIYITGVQGNTAANGTWVITKVDASNFTLNGSTGNGAYAPPQATAPAFGMASPYPNYVWFPFYNPASFGDSQANEVLNHPALFNVFDPNYNPPSTCRLIPWSDMEALLLYGGTNSPARSSDLFRLCPNSFTVAGSKAARLLTPHSFDFGRPGATPWLWTAAGVSPNPYQLLKGNTYPTIAAAGISTPAFAAGSPGTGEFGPDWRGLFGAQGVYSGKGSQSVGALLRKLDLNRTLTKYAADGGNDQQAIADRQQFAKDIFDRLRLATTGNWPTDAFPPPVFVKNVPTNTQYLALQWLAQLSVNIVDYIDYDNNITPWQWDTGNGAWVYGTENNRLVINEVYSEISNHPLDLFGKGKGKATKPYQVNFWVELLNPLADDVNNPGINNQTLQDKNATTKYELIIGRAAGAIPSDPTAPPPNVLLDITNYMDATGKIPPPVINPAGTNYSGTPATGFCVVGPPLPQAPFPAGKVIASVQVQESAASATPVPLAGSGLGYKVGDTITLKGGTAITPAVLKVTSVGAGGAVTGVTVSIPGSYTFVPPNAVGQAATSGVGLGATFNVVWNSMSYSLRLPSVGAGQKFLPHNVYLRRLACPALPFNNDKTKALYNPFVTIDVATNNWLNDAVRFDFVGIHVGPNGQSPFMRLDERYAVGRRQPYAAFYKDNGINKGIGLANWASSQIVGPGRPISNASNAAPIQITLNNHGFNSGDKVFINGVRGNTAANSDPKTAGTFPWTITVVNANNFTLNGSTGNGIYNPAVYPGLAYNGNSNYYHKKQPQHSLFQHNALEKVGPPSPAVAGQTLKIPFDWLVHMDRPMLSPVEIMQVSAYPPHQLTRRFMRDYSGGALVSTQRFQHLAPWITDPSTGLSSQNALLYRAFEFLEIASVAAGVDKNQGRIPGLININTVWDTKIMQALADPQLVSRFTAADVKTIFNNLLLSRNPNLGNGGKVATFAGDQAGAFSEKPFRGFSAGVVPAGDTVYPNGLGINDTLFRGNILQTGLSMNLTDNPYTKNELLSKIFNKVTTRSNVYAVWLTVGFFEVTDDTVTPPRLGQEIGRAEGRHIRHRMFAMVDRSAMLVPSQLTTLSGAVKAGSAQTVALAAPNLSGTTPLSGSAVIGSTSWGNVNTTMTWMIRPGCTLIVDQGQPAEEVIVVTATAGNSITANFVNPHAANAVVSVYGSQGPTINGKATVHGYPGPQSRFDPRYNTAVVPFYTIIE